MAYTKTTWNNLSNPPINADNLNKIEQGIYDNSLATDKINPSGTATTTAEIEEGQINDVIGFKSLKLKGQTSQYTTTGSQLFDINNTPSANRQYVINNGFKLTKGTNRTIQISLTNPIPAGTYYISADVTNSTLSGNNKINVSFKDANNTDVVGNVTFLTNGAVTTTAEVKDLYFFIASNEANTATITLDNIMLNSGSTRKDFEKYTGGKASPNPDFPQEVNNVSGYNVVGISNKNLIDGLFRQGSASTLTDTKNVFSQNNRLFKAGTYTFSTNLPNTMKFAIFGNTQKFPTANAVTYNSTFKNNITQFTFTFSQDLYLGLMITKTDNSAITPNDISTYHFQIEQGSSATSYTAHQGNNFEINLGKNLFNKENIIEGKRLTNDPQNQLTDAEGYYTSSFIKVNSNTTYTQNSPLADAFHRFAFYSSNSESGYLSISNENTIVTPSECEYVRFSGQINELDTTQLEKGAIATSFADYFPPIELCKIGTYADYIYKKDGKWWKHKEVEKITLNGSETPTINTALTNTTRALYSNILPYKSKAGAGSGICNLLPYYENWVTDVEGFYLDSNTTNLVFRINKSTVGTTITSVNNFLSENNMTVYYILETAIEEEITYAPLIRQLDELYNSGLYDVTNISQDNSSEAFILDLEACKNNINGIVEYIRR